VSDSEHRLDDAPGDAIERAIRQPLSRRRFLLRSAHVALAGTAVAIGAGGYALQQLMRPWDASVYPDPTDAEVAVFSGLSYDSDLEDVVRRGIRLMGLDPKGASVLLKPNIVEFDRQAAINTDPRLVAATAAAFLGLGARSVVVGEGSGHRRDTHYIAGSSGLLDLLRDVDTPFVDLNTAAVRPVTLQTSYTSLGELWLPAPVIDADIVVSMPKLKTHHWGGVTLSLKNCFGVVPGRIYGWPKNVLHWAGLENSILDVAAAVRPDFVIIDGIVGMEGDGPIKGTSVAAGLVVMGSDPVAADSTAAQLMGIDPERVRYLRQAGRFLGQVAPERIHQRGEDPGRHGRDFELLPQFRHLRIGAPNDAEPQTFGESA
jgi:uncharacterized protein (DUF362 family)